jgi:hypothetical protein
MPDPTFTDDGLADFLTFLISSGVEVGLWKTVAGGVDYGRVIADITEPTFGGYARVPISFFPVTGPGGGTEDLNGIASPWVNTDVIITSNDVYGTFFINPATGHLIWLSTLPGAPWVMGVPGATLAVSPFFQSLYP